MPPGSFIAVPTTHSLIKRTVILILSVARYTLYCVVRLAVGFYAYLHAGQHRSRHSSCKHYQADHA